MAESSIGYTPEKIKELREAVNEWLNGMPEKIESAWTPLQTKLSEEWVGEDEQSYESTLIKRLNELYGSACDLVETLSTEFETLGNDWHTLQKGNTFEGGEGVEEISINLEPSVPIEKKDSILTFAKREITNDQQRGLINGQSSKSSIEVALGEFVDQVKSDAEELDQKAGDLIDSAFQGVQGASLKSYLEQYEKSIGVVLTAVQDVYDGLETLASSAYTEYDESVQTSYSDDPTEKITEGVSSVKWSGQ